MRFLCAFALVFSSLAQARMFTVEDSQYNQKTFVHVTRPVSNALANEQLMGEIVRDAYSHLMLKLYELNGSNQIPESLIPLEAMRRFDKRGKELNDIVDHVNSVLVPIRERQLDDGMSKGDMIPDAFMFYFAPFKPTVGRWAALGTVAVVVTYVQDSTYEVSKDPSCKNVTKEQIKAELLNPNTNVVVQGCRLNLVNQINRKDYKFFGMLGVDKKFLANGHNGGKSFGFGFIWDTKNQLASAEDVAGGGVSVSIGPVFNVVSGAVSGVFNQLRKLKKADSTILAESVQAPGFQLDLPTKFNLAALLGAFKDSNNFRVGGIYSNLEIKAVPDYFTMTFDLKGKVLADIFGVDPGDVTPVDPTKGPPLKLGAYALVPLTSLGSLVTSVQQGLKDAAKTQVP